MNLRREYLIRPERCQNCGRCLAACPAGAIGPSATGELQIDREKCRRCGACRKVCRQGAITARVRLQC
jgi:ferredoxin